MKTEAAKYRQCGLTSLIMLDGLCPDCVNLRDRPDETSKRASLGGIPFKDLKQVDEADRFKMIANQLRSNPGKTVAVIVEFGGQHAGKGDRYIAGVKAQLPEAKVEARLVGWLEGTETIMFTL
jgi:hypothetical protein